MSGVSEQESKEAALQLTDLPNLAFQAIAKQLSLADFFGFQRVCHHIKTVVDHER